MIYIRLFLSFVKIGLFSIGGGYAAIPLIKNEVIDKYGWLEINEFTDLTSIAEMTPGPIALNASTFVGNRIAGFPGALIATAGCILPSLVIVTILFFIYKKYGKLNAIQKTLNYIRPAVIAFIASAGVTILINVITSNGLTFSSGTDIIAGLLFTLAFFAVRTLKISPIPVMLICGIIYLAANFNS